MEELYGFYDDEGIVREMRRYYLGIVSCLTLHLMAAPSLQEVRQGNAVLTEISKQHLLIEALNNTHLDWGEFSIAEGELVEFLQPSIDSVVVNRIVGDRPSEIFGNLLSNGQVFLINPQGVVIGKDAVIDTAAFIASTLSLQSDLNRDASWHFQGEGKALIQNYGIIKARHGDVVLLGYRIVNEGVIDAKDGAACLGSAEKVVLKPMGDRRIYIETSVGDSACDEVGIDQKGEIFAKEVELRSDGNLYALAINQEGLISAYSFDTESGEIVLDSGKGKLEQHGNLTAESGTVSIDGRDVWVKEGATIDVSGESRGGEIWIGGTKENTKSDYAFVEANAELLANAKESGRGGTISIWSKENTLYSGFAACTGGEHEGDGGFIEVSSHKGLGYYGRVDVTAKMGRVGKLLLDPVDITISSSSSSPAWSNPYAPSTNANANVTDIETALASADVTITTDGGSTGSGDVTISDDLTWSSGYTLTIQADGSITVDGEIRSSSGSPIDLTAVDTIHVNQDVVANGGDSSTRYIILKGATVNIGNSTQSNAVAVTTNQGNIYVEGTTAVNVVSSSNRSTTLQAKSDLILGGITGGDSRIGTFTARGNGANVTVRASGGTSIGNIYLYGSGDINIDASSGGKVEFETYNWSNTQLSSGAGNIIVDTDSGGLFIRGGSTNNDHAYISAGRGGDISITLSGASSHLSMTNGTANNCGAAILTQVGGDINISIQGDLSVTANSGGGTSGVSSEDFSCGLMAAYRPSDEPNDSRSAGNIVVSARDITMRGGDRDGDDVYNFAEISTGHLGGSGGSITINASRNISLTGGNGVADTQFWKNTNFTGFATLNRNGYTATSDFALTVNCSGGDINIIGGNGSNANGGIVTHNGGNCTINNAGIVTITGGGSTTGVARGGIGAGYLGGSGDVIVNCQTLIINGGSAAAPSSSPANYGAIEQYSGLGSVTVTASGTVTIAPGSNQYTDAMIRTVSSSGDNDITLSASSLKLMGASSGATADHDAKIYTNSGDIAISISNSLVLSGGDGLSKAQIFTANSSANTISIDAMSGSSTSAVSLLGGATSHAEIYTTNGPITIGSTRAIKDFTLVGGAGASSYGRIYTSTGGAITLNQTGELSLTGGSGATDASAKIATGTSSGTGDISVTCKDITLVGGSQATALAEILPSASGGSFTGSLSQNLKLNNVAGVSAPARILVQDSSSTLTLNAVEGSSGDITLGHASAEALSLVQTQGGVLSIGQTYPFSHLSLLGGSGTDATAKILTTTGGNLLITLDDHFSLTGGSGTSAAVAITSASSSGTGNMTLTGRDMTLIGGSTANTAIISGGSTGGDLSFVLSGDLVVGSSSMGAAASITNNKVDGDLIIDCSSVTLLGSDSAGVTASLVSTGTTNITTTGNCQLTAGSYNTAKALIQQNSGSNILTLAIGGSLGLTSQSNTSAEIISTCSIIGTVGSTVTLTGTSAATAKMQAENTLQLTTNTGSIALSYGSITNTERASLIRAAKSLTLTNDSTIVNLGSGQGQTLVVDNENPTAPSIGTGGITLSSNSSVSTSNGGELKIYSARPSQDSIQGRINGTHFGPGGSADSSNVEYGVYYPGGSYESPYMLYYKEAGSSTSSSVSGLTLTQKETAIYKASVLDSQGLYEMRILIDQFGVRVKPVTIALEEEQESI